MSSDDTSVAAQATPAEVERLHERIEDFTRVIEGAEAERDLLMYRAVKAGAAMADVAHWALLKQPKAEAIVASVACDPDADIMLEGPDYIEFWRHEPGFGPSH